MKARDQANKVREDMPQKELTDSFNKGPSTTNSEVAERASQDVQRHSRRSRKEKEDIERMTSTVETTLTEISEYLNHV